MKTSPVDAERSGFGAVHKSGEAAQPADWGLAGARWFMGRRWGLAGARPSGRAWLAVAAAVLLASGRLVAQTPDVTADAASQVTSSSATITGTVNPNGSATACWVMWGTTTLYDHHTDLADLPPESTPEPVSTTLSGLAPNTTYHYQLVATNSAGQVSSPDMSFTTMGGPPPAPAATTYPAANVTADSAILIGTFNLNGWPGGYYFRWGLTAAYGNVLPTVAVPAGSVLTVSQDLAGLSPNTTYHYQLVATNAGGTTFGQDMSFITFATTGDGNFSYAATNGGITIAHYTGAGGDVTIPASIDGLPVTAIGDFAFYFHSNVTRVAIPDTVTAIGDRAFQISPSLSSVILGANVATIGDSAFLGCPNLRELVLPAGLASIGDSAFLGSSLTNIVIPDSVTNIGEAAFAECGKLAGVTIGHGVTRIRGGGAKNLYGTFMFCSSLTSITIPDNVTNITDGAFYRVYSLGAFAGCGRLTNVVIGKGLGYLGTGAFALCTNLVSVYFAGNAPTPGQNMFGGDIFHNCDSAIIYYLSGSTGWDSTYASRPTMLWNATVQRGSFGTQENGFRLTITGTAGVPVVIEACTDLMSGAWAPVTTCTVSNGLLIFSDLGCSNYPMRFYRVRAP